MRGSLRIPWAALAVALVLPLAACGDDEQTTPPEDNAPSVTLTAPTGGEAFQLGETVTITFTATDDGTVTVDLSYTADGGSETVIASDLTGDSYDWTVPSSDMFGVTVKAVATDDANQTDEDESDIFAVVTSSARGYVTASVCQNCHVTKYGDVFDSGHPYKLNKVVNDQPPTYPNSTVPSPPTGVGWDEVTYVIGGYGWKARFLDLNGYIMVTGLLGIPVQYNLPRADLGVGSEWVDYHATDTEPKPYDCGSCHTTGWQDLTQNGGVHQDGLTGIEGTWEDIGVTCEACHGPGVDHVATKDGANITIDESSELCGSCHFRDPGHRLLTSGGYIRHHEQYDEWLNGGKPASVTCGTCHEPHMLTRYGNAAAGGILTTCESCHPDQAASNAHLVPVDCETCHLARATKSARAIHTFEGDVQTHLFTINPAPFPKDSMWVIDPVDSVEIAAGFVTLDFVCYQCHDDPITQVGGGGSEQTLTELSAEATGIHN